MYDRSPFLSGSAAAGRAGGLPAAAQPHRRPVRQRARRGQVRARGGPATSAGGGVRVQSFRTVVGAPRCQHRLGNTWSPPPPPGSTLTPCSMFYTVVFNISIITTKQAPSLTFFITAKHEPSKNVRRTEPNLARGRPKVDPRGGGRAF